MASSTRKGDPQRRPYLEEKQLRGETEPVHCGNTAMDHPAEDWACGTASQRRGRADGVGAGEVCGGGRLPRKCDRRRELRRKAQSGECSISPAPGCARSEWRNQNSPAVGSRTSEAKALAPGEAVAGGPWG